MKYLSVIVLIFLIGCSELPRTLEPDEPAISEMHIKDDYTHQASGMVFPVSVGSFKRTNMFRYDREAKNFSADYQMRGIFGRAAIIKVYIYPSSIVSHTPQPDINRHFNEVKVSLMDIYPDIDSFFDGTIKIGQKVGAQTGLASSFKHTAANLFKKKLCFSQVYLFEHGPWYIRYRVTYPESNHKKVDPQVGQFMHLLEWPELKK